jgi:hypothetical protein
MPHTERILPRGRYAVVSCHVERPLDDDVWSRFAGLQERRPGGFRIAALMRPPDANAREDEGRWVERAREAAPRGPLGLHTHWTAPDHARPTGGEPAALVREQIGWLRAHEDLRISVFCGGGWYMDEAVASVLAEHGFADCTATAFRPAYLPERAPRLHAQEPGYLELASGARVLELPTTHSIGMLVRAAFAPLREPLLHAYFHDTDLLEPRRRTALLAGLTILGRRREPTDLAELQRGFVPAKTMSFASSRG